MAYVDNSGVKIYYEVEGDGPPLILQHGVTSNLNSWRQNGYTDTLREKYTLILVDARGHGRSDKPHEVDAYKPEDMTGDINTDPRRPRGQTGHLLGLLDGGQNQLPASEAAPAEVQRDGPWGNESLPEELRGQGCISYLEDN